MNRQNLHTHSYYDDGNDSIEEMVQTAIEKGFTVLGFSGHGFNQPLDPWSMSQENTQAYHKEIARAQEKYEGHIEIYEGIEQDSMHRLDPDAYDYVIGSVHFQKKEGKLYPIDSSREEFEDLLYNAYQKDVRQMAADYYQQIAENAAYPEVDIIGHIDLITKYNENEEYIPVHEDWYLELAYRAIDEGIRHNKIFEMNSGAISRGYRTQAYPQQELLEYMARKGARLCINTDCHSRKNLDCNLSECLQRAKEAGFTKLMLMGPDGFTETDIESFF